MEKRKIASLDAEVSLLGFGLMRLPTINGESSKIDYPKAQAMIDRAFRAGVNYFDTAYVYHGKTSEVFAGETLSRYPRDSYYLATKMPTWDPVRTEDDVARIFDEQMSKCRTSYFDFYLVHSLNAERIDTLDRNIYRYLRKKKEEGAIRRLGFSFHDHSGSLKEIVNRYEWDFVQVQINYVDWDTADAKILYDTLTDKGLPVIVMEPIKGGTLARLNDQTMNVLKKCDPQAGAASWALRFAASLPNVMTVLSGMTEPEHVEENIKTFSPFRPLSDAERGALAEAVVAYHSTGTIPCTGCRYCMECPSGVEIPKVLAQYNHYLLTKNKVNYENQYCTLRDSEKAHNCVNCGKCVKLCPQKINIPVHMKEVADFFGAQM